MYLSGMNYDVIIVGGGLAGLTASIYLAKNDVNVLVYEKKPYPHHKVCGEYVSNEVRPFLEFLGLNLEGLGAVDITQFTISNQRGKKLHTQLPLGGFGISRFALDHALYQLALDNGVEFKFEAVESIEFQQKSFQVRTKKQCLESPIVIGSFGKRSSLDKQLNRSFMHKKSPWLGVKAHYHFEEFPEDQVELHCFEGGYGGLSKTESGAVNFCFLTHYKSFQQAKNIEIFTTNVVAKNPFLKHFLDKATPAFEQPLGIAQISFSKKECIQNHVMMCGDSAALIHPLCRNGMAMAIHAAKIASDTILRFFKEESFSREQLEKEYQKKWKSNFSRRLNYGRNIQYLITNPSLTNAAFSIFPKTELFLSSIIKQTHGKPILV